MSTVEKIYRPVKGEFFAEHLIPDPDQLDKFWPLWDARNLAIEAGNVEEEQRLTAEMRPYQILAGTHRIENLVTNVGLNDILDKYLKGSAYTQTIRMGLKGTGSAAAGDTQASHAGWLEVGLANAPTYTGNRKDVTMSSASGQSSNSGTQAFAMTSSGTVAGCFINNGGSSTKDNTTGVLVAAGDFSGGNVSVSNGSTLNVVWTLNAA